MNEPAADASLMAMSSPSHLADTPLTEAEWAAVVGDDGALGGQLRAALTGHVDVISRVFDALETPVVPLSAALAGRVDVMDGVFEALGSADVGLAGLVAQADLADAVMAAVDELDAMQIGAFVDGEVEGVLRAELARRTLQDARAQAAVQDQARLGAQLQTAVAGSVDLWDAIGGQIGADVAPVDARSVGEQLRSVLSEVSGIDVTAQVMGSVSPRARRFSLWVAVGTPVVALAAAAMMLIAVVPQMTASPSMGGSLAAVSIPFVLGSVNDAQVEAIETSADVVAQVVQFDEGGPTFILVDEGETL